MLGALYGQPLGGSGGTWGPSSRLNPYLVGQCPGSIPVLPRPRPATKHRDALAAPSTWGIGWEGEGARGGPMALRAPLVFPAWAAPCKLGLEGIVSNRKDPGR